MTVSGGKQFKPALQTGCILQPLQNRSKTTPQDLNYNTNAPQVDSLRFIMASSMAGVCLHNVTARFLHTTPNPITRDLIPQPCGRATHGLVLSRPIIIIIIIIII
jgi:hypothetical protein